MWDKLNVTPAPKYTSELNMPASRACIPNLVQTHNNNSTGCLRIGPGLDNYLIKYFDGMSFSVQYFNSCKETEMFNKSEHAAFPLQMSSGSGFMKES